MNKADWAKYKKALNQFSKEIQFWMSENALLINWFKGIQDLDFAIFYVFGIWNLIRSCMYIICDLLASRWVKGLGSSVFFYFLFIWFLICDQLWFFVCMLDPLLKLHFLLCLVIYCEWWIIIYLVNVCVSLAAIGITSVVMFLYH